MGFSRSKRRATSSRRSGRKRFRSAPRRRRINARTAGFLGIEKKFYDSHLSSKALNATTDNADGECNPSATLTLNTVAQGDGESNRDGRKMVMKSVQVTGSVFCSAQANQSAADAIPIIFIALVLDKQTNGAALSSELVYVNPSADTGLCTNPVRNLQYVSRFRVLRSTVFVPPQPAISYDGTNIEQGGVNVPFRFDADLKDLPVTFSGDTSAISNIIDNSLHVLAWASTTGMAPSIQYNCRLRFVG